MIKVRAMLTRSGKVAANQYIITAPHLTIFQSYDSTIAIKLDDGRVLLDETYWNYSSTTSRYRNRFLHESTAQITAKVESGEYKLVNLNTEV